MFIGEIFGPDLLIVIIVGAVFLFGGAAIPKFARNLGQTKTEFEKGMHSVNEIQEAAKNPTVATKMNETDPVTKVE
jgi:Sec-independent protein translocase protein TatA